MRLEKLDLEAVAGGDCLMGNGSTVKLEQIGIQYHGQSQPSNDPEPEASTADSGGEGGETDGEGTEGSGAGSSA